MTLEDLKSCFINRSKTISVKISLKVKANQKKPASKCFGSCLEMFNDLVEVSPTHHGAQIQPERWESCCSGRWEFTGSDLPAGIEQLLQHSSWCLPKINSEEKVIFPFAVTNRRPTGTSLVPPYPCYLNSRGVPDFADFAQNTKTITSGR